MKSTNELIEKLSLEHRKIKRDFNPLIRTVLFLYGPFSIMVVLLYLRNPYIYRIYNLAHFLELLTLFIFINALTYLGFKSFIPGESKKTSLFLVGLSLLLTILVFAFRSVMPQTFHEMRAFCEVEAIAISVITTTMVHMLVRKNEYAENNLYSSALFISLPIMATLFLHGTCSLELVHVITCHLIPPLMAPLLYLAFIPMKKRN